MTLSEWADANGVYPQLFDKPGYEDETRMAHPRPTTVWTVPDSSYVNRSDLWHLSDYVVTSVTAGTIWLVPRRSPERT